jgi:HPt (histidine-containing phosphotransfer) domain-containing protein
MTGTIAKTTTAVEASGRAAGGFLSDLAAMLPPGSLHALLETGRRQIHGEIGALARAATAGRGREAQRCAHRLAGSAGVLGLGRLVAAARAAEAAATSGDRTSLGSAIAEARSAADEALAELGRWLADSDEPTCDSGVGVGG